MTDKSIASIANISEQDLLSFTPAMRQFIQIKRDNPTLLIMYRMGDFYETFFEDAELVHRVLGLTLTSRSSFGQSRLQRRHLRAARHSGQRLNGKEAGSYDHAGHANR